MPCSSGKSLSLPLVVAAGVELMEGAGLKEFWVLDMEVPGINGATPEQISTPGRNHSPFF